MTTHDYTLLFFWIAFGSVGAGVIVHTIQTHRWMKLMRRALEQPFERELWELARERGENDLWWARLFTKISVGSLALMVLSIALEK